MAKEFNIILYFLINFDLIVPENIISKNGTILTFNATKYPCAEVQISVNFLTLVATEVAIYVIRHPLKFVLFKAFKSCKNVLNWDES